MNIDPEIDSQIVDWTKMGGVKPIGAIHDSIIPTGQNQTAWIMRTGPKTFSIRASEKTESDGSCHSFD